GDWYLGLHILGLPMIVAFLATVWWMRSSCIAPPALWLWSILLVLSLFPAVRGSLNLFDALYYYPNVVVAALITFWMGTLVARDAARLYRLFLVLAAFATGIGVHTLITAGTGVMWFASTKVPPYGDAYFYPLGSSGLYRIGSFFVDPNWNGSFLGLMLFISLGLSAASRGWLAKTLFLGETALLSFALLFTFSAGAWISTGIGMTLFLLLVGRHRRFLICVMAALPLTMLAAFPSGVDALLGHISDPVALSLRHDAWRTAARVILAFPLTGVGLGTSGYAARTEPFRSPTDTMALDHPHNSYLELAAMAGLPVLITFVALLAVALRRAVRNWARSPIAVRPLLAGGLTAIAVLSINSITINAWTIPPLTTVGWLLLGAISSPLLGKDTTARD